jgi:hypothetical protein
VFIHPYIGSALFLYKTAIKMLIKVNNNASSKDKHGLSRLLMHLRAVLAYHSYFIVWSRARPNEDIGKAEGCRRAIKGEGKAAAPLREEKTPLRLCDLLPLFCC